MARTKTGRGVAGRAVACGAILAGVATGALIGANPASADTGSDGQSFQMVELTNYTPYTWNLESRNEPGTQAPAPQTILPGQTAVWDGDTGANIAEWRYTYTLPQGNGVDYRSDKQLVDVVENNGYVRIAVDDNGYHNQTAPSRLTHEVQDADGYQYHWDVYWNTPVTVTIDNATDSAAATSAVNGQFPRAVDGSVRWTTNTGSEAWNWGAPTRATGMLYNYSSADAKLDAGQETSVGQRANFGLEITGSVGMKVFGTSAKLAASVDLDKEWGSEDSTEVTADMDVAPGQVGWIDKKESTGALTGELQFTTPEGVTFDLKNVTLSQGDLVNPDAGKSPIRAGVLDMPHTCQISDAPCYVGH